jgi:hypothetical protein
LLLWYFGVFVLKPLKGGMHEMFENKGQSALEYLMTYGWALVVIVIVIAILVSLGVFNLTQNICTGFPSQFTYSSHDYTAAGSFTLTMQNGWNSDVNIVDMNIVGDTTGSPVAVSQTISKGAKGTITASGFTGGTSGNTYSKDIVITYNVGTEISGKKMKIHCSGTYS